MSWADAPLAAIRGLAPVDALEAAWSCLQDSFITTEALSGFPALSNTKCSSSSSPWQRLGMNPLLVCLVGDCAGLGLGEQALGRVLREMGLFPLLGEMFWFRLT